MSNIIAPDSAVITPDESIHDIWDLVNNAGMKCKHVDEYRSIDFLPQPHFKPIFKEMFAAGGHKRHIVLKPRRAFMTSCAVAHWLMFGAVVPHSRCYIINYTKKAGAELMRDVIKFFVQNCPMFNTGTAFSERVVFAHPEGESDITNIINARSGGGNIAHFTDFAKMVLDSAAKAEEALTGTIEALPKGGILVESTSAGNVGKFADMCRTGEEINRKGIKPHSLQFKLWFFPWFSRHLNRAAQTDMEDPEIDLIARMESDMEYQEYLSKLRTIKYHGAPLEERQICWHYQKWEAEPFNRDWNLMFQEHPTSVEEALMGDVDSQFLASTIQRIRGRGQIGDYREDGSPVYVSWDFGTNTSWTVMWFWQLMGEENTPKLIDFFRARKYQHGFYQGILERRGYNYAKLIFPHDAEHADSKNAENYTGEKGKSIKQKFYESGWRNIEVVPRIHRKREGFDASISYLLRCRFSDAKILEEGINGLASVRQRTNEHGEVVMGKDGGLVKDSSADIYDAFETGARYFLEIFNTRNKLAQDMGGLSDYYRQRAAQRGVY